MALPNALIFLNNLLDHQLIYPKLDHMGLPKGDGECQAIGRQVEQWLGIHKSGNINDPFHRCVAYISMVYICSRCYCKSDSIQELDRKMDGFPEIEEARKIGEKLLPQLTLKEESSVDDYRLVLEAFVEGLGLTEDDAGIMG